MWLHCLAPLAEEEFGGSPGWQPCPVGSAPWPTRDGGSYDRPDAWAREPRQPLAPSAKGRAVGGLACNQPPVAAQGLGTRLSVNLFKGSNGAKYRNGPAPLV